MPPMAPGGWRRKTSTVSRNSGNASSVFSARTSAMFCAITGSMTNSSARASDLRCCTRDASARYRGPPRGIAEGARDRLLQHHEMLHEGLPGEHSDHRQRDHPVEGAGRGRPLRSAGMDLEEVKEESLNGES